MDKKCKEAKELKNVLSYLDEEIGDKELELEELGILYKEKKIPYRHLKERTKELVTQIREDIIEEIHKANIAL